VKEKELRIALVCYGGVSLAVYMHGVVKEVWKLVRASRALHAVDDPLAKPSAPPPAGDDIDSEGIYFELLQAIGRNVDLRVVVDAIAGASAGGINGVLLARALAHDLSMEPLTRLWLEGADVERLMAPEVRAGRWSKWFLHPMLWLAGLRLLRRLAPEREVRAKLSTFVRSRWFKPPFDGPALLASLADALDAMGRSDRPAASLLPEGHRLDLFVTVTDFHGYAQRIPLHDPPSVLEREHRHVLAFAYRRRPGGVVDSDFADAEVPALAFAARATACFPGAFQPAQLREVDRWLAARARDWPGREAFLRRNFAPYREHGVDPAGACFIDGAVLNNKPFAEAIAAVRERPAYREVDRRVVYVEPDPEAAAGAARARAMPGFFRTILGAMAEIPRAEPVRDELVGIANFNRSLRRLKAIVDEERPEVRRLVRQLAGQALDGPLDAERLAALRDGANARAAGDAGYAYRGYLRLKLLGVEDWLIALLAGAAGHPPDSAGAEAVGLAVRRHVTGLRRTEEAGSPAWIGFLLSFDVSFRARRLRFLIRAANQLYPRLASAAFAGLTAARLDSLKRRLYDALALFRTFERREFLSAETRGFACRLFGTPQAPAATPADEPAVADLLRVLATEIDLRAANRMVDETLAEFAADAAATPARRELLFAYLGFAFWDVMTFAVTEARDLGEFDEVRVDRISPDDAGALRGGGARAMLKGVGFGHFAAFFSRQYRENDYLWGRLHAAERLLDIVADAGRDPGSPPPDLAGLRRRIFLAILRTEWQRLETCREGIDELLEVLLEQAASA